MASHEDFCLISAIPKCSIDLAEPHSSILTHRANTTYNLPYQKDKCEIVFTNDFTSCFYIIFLRKIQQQKLKHKLEITRMIKNTEHLFAHAR